MADLAHAVSIDPAMTATVLKLVNSAFYAMPTKSRDHFPCSEVSWACKPFTI
jgi:HD-like signal output (HDOD) protein